MRKLILIFLILAVNGLALGNDTIAVVTPTGMSFEKSDRIKMESEDLRISIKHTSVKYRFINETDDDIKATVAFPLPRLFVETPYNFATTKKHGEEVAPNPLQFVLKVDGRQEPFQADLRFDKESGLIDLKYYWGQVFPRRKSILMEHDYITGSGSSFPENADEKYCFDSDFKNALQKLKAELTKQYKRDKRLHIDFESAEHFITLYLHYHTRLIDYILKTGANWKGPIGKFRMTLDKSSPGNLMSLCWSGLKKCGKTSFEFKTENYVPMKDLSVLIIDRKKVNDLW